MLQTVPFLLFDGNCADAMTFYQSCLGGQLAITRVGDTPMKAQLPPQQYHKVAFAHLKNGVVELSATDWLHPTRIPTQGNTVAVYVTGTYDEVRGIFDALSAGADASLLDELRNMPLGAYGHLADKYGVHWFFRGESAPASNA